jgi:uncharacterized protein with PQ loop repeat
MNASAVLFSAPVMCQSHNSVTNHFRILCVRMGFCSWLNYGMLGLQEPLLYQCLSTLGQVFIAFPIKLLIVFLSLHTK